jgi:hypothetical protein
MSEDNIESTTPTEGQVQAEKEARLLGWVPKEEFRDGEHWVDAETFVKRGKEINPILRKNNETLLKKLDEANREISEVKKVAKDFEKFQKEQAERKVLALETELKALKEQKKAAITQGDGETVVDIDEQIDALKEEQRLAKEVPKEIPSPKQAPVTLDPLVTSWMEVNTWFITDQKYTRIADAIGQEINATRPDLKGQAFFDELDKELEEVLPEKYLKQGRRSPVEAGAPASTSRPKTGTKKQSYENLPPDAKAACDRFVKQGFMTRESYVAEYDWE